MPTSATASAPVTSCEPGYFTGREAITPCSLPQATTEPVRLTEPMTAPSSVAMTKASGSSSPGWSELSRWNSTTATSTAAPPPAPLKMATICGMAVIATRLAPSQPATAPMAPPTDDDPPVVEHALGREEGPSPRSRAMPAAPSRLPVRADFGLARNLSARMNVTLATSQTR